MLSVSFSSSPNKKGPSFLHFATRNYISARVLFLSGQHFDGGVVAHEAIEKVLKSILYQLNDDRTIKSHKITELKEQVESELSVDLSEFNDLFEYYRLCYTYRYPDNVKPTSFSTGTKYIHLLDHAFIHLHDISLPYILEDTERNKSGIFSYCTEYFIDDDPKRIDILLRANDDVSIDRINEAKTFWHNRGIYKKDEKGNVRFPEGVVAGRK